MELSIVDVKKSFGENNVLKGINLSAKSGRALGILGRNGAGKTTTIRILMGVFAPDAGKVELDGQEIDRRKTVMGYLPEERGLYPKKVIIEQLIYFGMLKNMTRKEAAKSAKYWLDRLEMSEYTNRRLDTLSKGNQQKIQLVVTLIANPDIIILDEPFSGLDPVNAKLLKDAVKELVSNDKIVLFSSHQMSYVEEFCNDVAILNGGEIVLSGDIKEIKRSYDRKKIIIKSDDMESIKNTLDEDCVIDNERLIVNLKSEGDKPALLSKLANMDVDIDEIKVYEPSMDDIFVRYTEDRI